MSSSTRSTLGDVCYHVLNRGNNRQEIFHDDYDYQLFETIMVAASKRVPKRVISYCLMPNHVHLCLWPHNDGDLTQWMRWALSSYARNHHKRHGTEGHLWQGRFKAFPIETDEYLLTVMRYIERNPVRAHLVATTQAWPYSSANVRSFVCEGPIAKCDDWLSWANRAQTPAELEDLRNAFGGKRQRRAEVRTPPPRDTRQIAFSW